MDASTPRKPWSEEETVLALYLYFQLPFGKLDQRNPEVRHLASALGRTNSSVAMKLVNFASLDPKITGSGRKGLEGASKLDRAVYAEFGQDWTGLVSRAEAMWDAQVGAAAAPSAKPSVHETPDAFDFEPFAGESTTQAMVNLRRGQGFFRRAVLANYEESCCVSGIADPRLLVASHIRPWGKDVENRHNPANGLLLSATLDKAFDSGLITIDRDHRILVSRELSRSRSAQTRDYFAQFDSKSIRPARRFEPDPAFLDWHSNSWFLDRRQA